MVRNSDTRPETDEPGEQTSVKRMRVLLADDHARVLNAVAALLEGSFDVIGLVLDGQAALQAALKFEPDLIVLDVSMPRMSGIEVARELKKRRNAAKIVFLTVHEDAEILASCLAAGGTAYVVKELMNSDLIPAIDAALSGRTFVSQFALEGEAP